MARYLYISLPSKNTTRPQAAGGAAKRSPRFSAASLVFPLLLVLVSLFLPVSAQLCDVPGVLQFTGTLATAAVIESFAFPPGSFTVEWRASANANSAGETIPMVAHYSSGAMDNLFYAWAETGGLRFHRPGLALGTVVDDVQRQAALDGTVRHMAFTYNDVSGHTESYVDGVLVATFDQSPGDGLGVTTGPLVFGHEPDARYPTNSGKFDPAQALVGVVEFVRIWSTVRTQGQIAASMSSEITGCSAGLALNLNFDSCPAIVDECGNTVDTLQTPPIEYSFTYEGDANAVFSVVVDSLAPTVSSPIPLVSNYNDDDPFVVSPAIDFWVDPVPGLASTETIIWLRAPSTPLTVTISFLGTRGETSSPGSAVFDRFYSFEYATDVLATETDWSLISGSAASIGAPSPAEFLDGAKSMRASGAAVHVEDQSATTPGESFLTRGYFYDPNAGAALGELFVSGVNVLAFYTFRTTGWHRFAVSRSVSGAYSLFFDDELVTSGSSPADSPYPALRLTATSSLIYLDALFVARWSAPVGDLPTTCIGLSDGVHMLQPAKAAVPIPVYCDDDFALVAKFTDVPGETDRPVLTYSMPNGGQGSYRYHDRDYTGTGDPTVDGAMLSGGTGYLTDGVYVETAWDNGAGVGIVMWEGGTHAIDFDMGEDAGPISGISICWEMTYNHGIVHIPDSFTVEFGDVVGTYDPSLTFSHAASEAQWYLSGTTIGHTVMYFGFDPPRKKRHIRLTATRTSWWGLCEVQFVANQVYPTSYTMVNGRDGFFDYSDLGLSVTDGVVVTGLGDLTDGQVGGQPLSATTSPYWVGWLAGTNNIGTYVDIDFSFADRVHVNEVRIFFNLRNSGGCCSTDIHLPSRIEIFEQTNGGGFVLADAVDYTIAERSALLYARFINIPVTATGDSIRVRCHNDKWTFIGEVIFLGKPAASQWIDGTSERPPATIGADKSAAVESVPWDWFLDVDQAYQMRQFCSR